MRRKRVSAASTSPELRVALQHRVDASPQQVWDLLYAPETARIMDPSVVRAGTLTHVGYTSRTTIDITSARGDGLECDGPRYAAGSVIRFATVLSAAGGMTLGDVDQARDMLERYTSTLLHSIDDAVEK